MKWTLESVAQLFHDGGFQGIADAHNGTPSDIRPLDVINHLRTCSTAEVHVRLEKLQKTDPEKYSVIVRFLLTCDPKAHNTLVKLEKLRKK